MIIIEDIKYYGVLFQRKQGSIRYNIKQRRDDST